MAGEARTHGACVTSVLCARVLGCKTQSSEHGRGSGEAEPCARHASLCAKRKFLLIFAHEKKRFLLVSKNATRAYIRTFAMFARCVCERWLLERNLRDGDVGGDCGDSDAGGDAAR